ncbi:MAG TPA: hypothetical protein VMG10_13360, partial [Gemmataceae bacterium]|nr:hypothetical protein [Gemmataceae bacterium]
MATIQHVKTPGCAIKGRRRIDSPDGIRTPHILPPSAQDIRPHQGKDITAARNRITKTRNKENTKEDEEKKP